MSRCHTALIMSVQLHLLYLALSLHQMHLWPAAGAPISYISVITSFTLSLRQPPQP